MSPSREKLAHHADPEPLWLSTGTDIIVVSATPPLRWMLKPSKRMNKK